MKQSCHCFFKRKLEKQNIDEKITDEELHTL